MKNQQRFLVSVSGFSGSGKSFLAKFLSELFDFPLVSLTKIVGTKLENMFPQMKNLDVVERIEFGYNYVLEINKRFPAEILMEYCKNNSPYSTGLIIDGVKNPKDVSLLLTDFTLYLPIFVVSGYNTRIERIMKRDKLAKNSAERYLIKRDYMDIKVGILEMFKNAEILVLNEIESERQINPSLSILGSIVKKKLKIENIHSKSIYDNRVNVLKINGKIILAPSDIYNPSELISQQIRNLLNKYKSST